MKRTKFGICYSALDDWLCHLYHKWKWKLICYESDSRHVWIQ